MSPDTLRAPTGSLKINLESETGPGHGYRRSLCSLDKTEPSQNCPRIRQQEKGTRPRSPQEGRARQGQQPVRGRLHHYSRLPQPGSEAPRGHESLFPEDCKVKPSSRRGLGRWAQRGLRRNGTPKEPCSPSGVSLEDPHLRTHDRRPKLPTQVVWRPPRQASTARQRSHSPRRSCPRRRRLSCCAVRCTCTGWREICCWAWGMAPGGSPGVPPSCWCGFREAASWLLTRRRTGPSDQHY